MKRECEIQLPLASLFDRLGIQPDADTEAHMTSLHGEFMGSVRGCVWFSEISDVHAQALFDGLSGDGRGFLLVAASVSYHCKKDGDMFAEWVADALGNLAVQYVQNEFLEWYCKENSCGVKPAAQPGSDSPHGWVRTIIDITNAEITLTDSMLMLPKKSVALIFSLTDGGCLTHDCTRCTAHSCTYRSDKRVRLAIRRPKGEDVVEVPLGSRLLDILRRYDAAFAFPCAGRGVCGKCAVRFITDEPILDADRAHIPPERLKDGIRLACAHTVDNNTEIELLYGGAAQILSSVNGELAAADNLKDGSFLDIKAGNARYIAAVDIGTTTVCVALVDTLTPRLIAIKSFLNPQAKYGADVISRIKYCDDNKDGLAVLHALITDSINAAVTELCKQGGIYTSDIAATAVAGNTVMQHILTGDPITTLGRYPFTPIYLSERIRPAKAFDLFGAAAYVMPAISGYVGGDIVAGLVTLTPQKRYSLLLDLGTNGEIVLFNDSEILAASTAVGPAFEGVNIECGIPAVDGAVTDVRLVDNLYRYDFLGDRPTGLCGSGLLSFAAVLLEQGLVDESGYMPSERVYLTDSIYLSQKDIRQLQLAKSAVRSGILTLMAKRYLSSGDIDAVYLAGGFGNYAKPAALCAVGILDPILTKKARQIGNSSLDGCIQTALSADARKRAVRIASTAAHIDLSAEPLFSQLFIEEMSFNG